VRWGAAETENAGLVLMCHCFLLIPPDDCALVGVAEIIIERENDEIASLEGDPFPIRQTGRQREGDRLLPGGIP